MSDPFPSLGALLCLGLAEKTRMEHDRQAQEERYLSADIVKRLGVAGLAVGVLGLIWSYMPAHAADMPKFEQVSGPQIPCMPADEFAKNILGGDYSEQAFVDMTMTGPDGKPVKVILFGNPKTGTWTFAMIPSQLIVCPLFGGDGLKPAKPFTYKKPGIPS